MANATDNLIPETAGDTGPMVLNLPVKGTTHIYKGTLVAQNASGYALPYSASGALVAIGVAQHEQNNTGSDGDKRVAVESHRIYVFANGAGGDAFADTSPIGAPAYATDDHTVADNSSSATRKCVGFFMGFEADGKVRVLINPSLAYLINALATLTDTPASADALRDNIVASML
jgi:hypothetical protein